MLFESLKIKDVRNQVGALVKALRASQNLSQDQLAETLDLSRITIQNLETGKNITLDTLLKVFQYFDLLEKFSKMLQEEHTNTSYDSLY